MRKILLSSTILFSISTANALTVEEAITHGYKNDEAHQQIRTVFLNEIEQFPKALANFMPKVNAKFSDINQRSHLKNVTDIVGGKTRTKEFSKEIALEQPVFNGGSSVAELKAAQASFRASRAKYYSDEQKAILEEINNYISCAEAIEKYDISKISVKSNRTQLEAMKERFRLGETTETEVASAESALAAAEAAQSRAYSDLEAAKANFNRVFGVEPTNVTLPPVPSGLPSSLEELTERTLKSNLEIDEANNQTMAAKSTELASKGALLPSASIRVSHGKDFFDPRVPTTGEKTRDTLTSTLSVNVPILAKGGAEYSEIRRAKNNTRLSAIKLDAQLKAVKANCKAEWEAFMASKQTIAAAEKGVKAAEIAYSGIIQEEMLGSKTIVDVLNFEERLNKARKDRIDARKEYIVRGYRIKVLLGQLTAKSMKLPVAYFEPEDEFKNIKKKIIGF